jgi:hypothetical protein
MQHLKENLEKFLKANLLKPKSREALKAEICYCQGYIAAMQEGEEREKLTQICGVFHFAGRSIL